MSHYTEITRKLRSVHVTNLEAAALIEELVADLDKAKEMLREAREAYTTETQSTMDMAGRITQLEQDCNEWKRNFLHTQSKCGDWKRVAMEEQRRAAVLSCELSESKAPSTTVIF